MVTRFVIEVLQDGNFKSIDTYIAKDYIQHNPNVKNKRAGFKEYINDLVEEDRQFSYKKIHKVVADGSFVYVYSQGSYDNKVMVFCDLFRVDDGMIVKHWDVIQEVPEESLNTNTMF